MRATQYDKRVTVQTRTKISDGRGGWLNEWSDSYTSWASVRPLRGMRRLEYGQMGFTVVYEVEMRKRVTNVNRQCQVVYGGNAYQIVSLEIDEERVYMDMARK